MGLFHFKALLTMSRSNSSSSYEADEDFMLSEQPDIKVKEDEAEFSLQPYICSSQLENCLLVSGADLGGIKRGLRHGQIFEILICLSIETKKSV